MAGDGVSLQTNLAQLGNVAKSQAQSQQSSTAAKGNIPEDQRQEAQPLQKISEAEKTAQKKVDAEKRKKRHKEKKPSSPDDPGTDQESLDEDENQASNQPDLGCLVDLKA